MTLARRIGTGLGALAGAGALCVGWGVLEAHTQFRLRRYEVPVLPAGAAPIRVLHVSDLHLMPYQQRKRRFVAGLAALRPDLVVTTGDHLATDAAIDPLLESFGELLELPGVYVFGSNDYTGPYVKSPLVYFRTSAAHREGATLDSARLQRAFDGHGWHDLMGRRARLEVRGTTVEFRGTHDYHMGIQDYERVAGPASAGVGLSVGVTHAPYHAVLDPMTADGCALILAGHTHGGQVCIPAGGALVTNCDLPRRHAKGLFRHEAGDASSWVHVSAGLGTSPYAPYRFACPPEASLLTLVPATTPA